MSEYGQSIMKHLPTSSIQPYETVKEKKEARKKLLAEIEQRRRENYKRFMQKQRLQADSNIDILAS